jgi:hypothetical protein
MWMCVLTMPGVSTNRSPPITRAGAYRARRSLALPTATIVSPRTATAPWRMMSRSPFIVTT